MMIQSVCVLFVGDPLSKDPTSVRTDTNHSVTSLSFAGPAEPPHTAEPLHTAEPPHTAERAVSSCVSMKSLRFRHFMETAKLKKTSSKFVHWLEVVVVLNQS